MTLNDPHTQTQTKHIHTLVQGVEKPGKRSKKTTATATGKSEKSRDSHLFNFAYLFIFFFYIF